MPVGVGLTPTLPEPDQSLIPTVNIAKAIGWPEGAKPIAADGFSVNQFAGGLTHPRWLYVLPNGDVLVADSNAPSNREGESGLLHYQGICLHTLPKLSSRIYEDYGLVYNSQAPAKHEAHHPALRSPKP